MNRDTKPIYTWDAKPSRRNLTAADIRACKGVRKLTQTTANTVEEAEALPRWPTGWHANAAPRYPPSATQRLTAVSPARPRMREFPPRNSRLFLPRWTGKVSRGMTE